ncbi:MAG: tyrosine--tRNA ligase [Candidatus Pacearchaeota archaeon]|nr:tyrosine--tRNA ligase [Candidatus Pacearchaeota archaeon]
MKLEEKFELITRNLQEIIGEKELKEKISKKDISIYWGTMPTGSISIAYFFPMLKIADFLKAGCNVKILIADLHAALDSVPWDLLEKRSAYYTEAIKLILKSLDVNIKNLEFVKGSDIQLNKDYFHDLLKLSTITSIKDSIKAASEGVKSAQGENIKLSGLIYPLMQALDEEYLKVDAQFGGLDQRKLMVYARENLPKINYNSKIELMTPMIRGLIGEKMSSSIESTKIDLLDNENKVIKKINSAEFTEGNPNNGVMSLLKYLIFPMKKDKKEKLIITRQKKFGGDILYKTYAELEKDVIEKKVHPLDIKNSVAKEINKSLEKIQTAKLKKLYSEAYPEK